MKISRILFTVVILSSVFWFVNINEELIKVPVQTASDRVGA